MFRGLVLKDEREMLDFMQDYQMNGAMDTNEYRDLEYLYEQGLKYVTIVEDNEGNTFILEILELDAMLDEKEYPIVKVLREELEKYRGRAVLELEYLDKLYEELAELREEYTEVEEELIAREIAERIEEVEALIELG